MQRIRKSHEGIKKFKPLWLLDLIWNVLMKKKKERSVATCFCLGFVTVTIVDGKGKFKWGGWVSRFVVFIVVND